MTRRTRGGVVFGGSFEDLPVPDLDALRRSLRSVIRTSADFAKALWLQRAQDLQIRRSGAYLAGIQNAPIRTISETMTDSDLGFVFEIINTAPHARIIEDGHAAFHLPSVIDWSSRNGRIKRGRNGVPYLNIPFGHAAFATPAQRAKQGLTVATVKTMLPADVYRDAKQLARTVPLKVGPQFRTVGGRLGGSNSGPRFVAGAETSETWRSSRTVQGRSSSGQRLTNPAWQNDRFSGLMKTGPTGHTKYLTIRTVTPHSPGWNIPSQQGFGIARQVSRALNSGVGNVRFQALLLKTIHDALTTARSP